MTEYVSIEGLDTIDVQLVLFRNSQRYGMQAPTTEDILGVMDFSGNSFDPTPYDKAHESGYARRVIERFRQTGLVERFTFPQ